MQKKKKKKNRGKKIEWDKLEMSSRKLEDILREYY